MTSNAQTPEEYIESLSEDRRTIMRELHSRIVAKLPEGFEARMNYGMLGYVVPHSLYPPGYHCDPKLPLPFMNLASQKNYVSLYHMGLYADQHLMVWFTREYEKLNLGKLDAGKSCIRFKKAEKIPLDLIAELAGKVTVQEWIEVYEKNLRA